MAKLKQKKVKIAAILAGAFLFSMPNLEAEAVAFQFTAPSSLLVKVSCEFLAKHYELSPKEEKFVQLVKIP